MKNSTRLAKVETILRELYEDPVRRAIFGCSIIPVRKGTAWVIYAKGDRSKECPTPGLAWQSAFQHLVLGVSTVVQ